MLRILENVGDSLGFWLSHRLTGFPGNTPVLAFLETGSYLRLSHSIPKSYVALVLTTKPSAPK
jgi:hypothetical protein